MQIKNALFLIFSLGICYSCKTAADKNTEAFLHYARSYGVTPADSCVYFFFPGNQCKNCFYFDAARLPVGLNERLMVFSGFPDKRIKGFRHFYYDTSSTMLELPFLDYGSRIVTLKNGQLENIVPLHHFYEQMDSLSPK